MITPNEIRLGNWLGNDKGGWNWSNRKIGYVESISKDGINDWQDMGASGRMKWEDLYGIKLTPDILEDNGFETLSVGSWYTSYWQQYKPDIDFILNWYTSDGRIDYEEKIIIKYVHQLQNLYFVLIGEELKIEL